jgi:NADPH:quinone reductase-like Zn-dependent oxidoreductase
MARVSCISAPQRGGEGNEYHESRRLFSARKPDVLHYRDVPLPVCGPDDVLVKIEAIALEGGDVINRATAVPGPEGAVPGYSAAGSIVAVGVNVKDRHPGQRVATIALAGSHAEYRVAPAAWSWVIPQGLDVAAAAVIPVSFGTAARALFSRLNLKAGETLLIQGGAGGVGVAAIQLAKAGAHGCWQRFPVASVSRNSLSLGWMWRWTTVSRTLSQK